jgi:eukaryotic-like serine/threonine-protein kinase
MTRMTDQIGRVLGGRYRLISPLGSGASAQVYLADDVRLRRRVAVKVLHPALADDASFLRRFRAEAQSAASLSHPHIVAVYDWSGDDDSPYLVTEYLSGGSLRTLLDAGHRLSPAQALVVGLEAARALDHAHRQGFVHRDVKPANLLFGADGRLRVADFGLARAVAEAGWTEPSGAVVGTARYASPEQARGESVDGHSDVYSLALVLIESVTGQVPFAADTTISTLMARLDHPIEVPDELGPLKPILAHAGQVDPNERLDAAAVGTALVAAASELDRPIPLPLASDVPGDGERDTRDATLLGPAAQAARYNGSDATVVARRDPGPDATNVLAAPAGGLAAPPAPPPPWGTGMAPAHALSDNDRGARRLMLGALVVVLAVAIGVVGAWAYVQSQVESYPVPAALIGMQRQAVPAMVDDFDWTIEEELVRRPNTEPGEVVETRPAAGEDLREGSTLTLVVSEGPPLVAVPDDLVGLQFDEARAALENAGLQAEEVPQPNEDVPEGEVTGFADGEPPAELPQGDTVRLVVSSGDELEMPDLEGRDYAEAVAELEASGLEVQLEQDNDDDRRVGEVIRTEPEAGDEVEVGDEVVVVVAGGEADVPDVTGLTFDEASAEIEDAGLVVGEVTGPQEGRVLATWPLTNTEVVGGSSVDLIMRPDG